MTDLKQEGGRALAEFFAPVARSLTEIATNAADAIKYAREWKARNPRKK